MQISSNVRNYEFISTSVATNNVLFDPINLSKLVACAIFLTIITIRILTVLSH